MTEPNDANTIYCASRAEWHDWLAANHHKKDEVWLTFYKKKSGKPSLGLHDAIYEGICFGWVDSVMHALNPNSYILRFTPRKPTSNWSKTNRQRARKMIAEGLMTPAGLAKITFPLDEVDLE